MTETVTIGPTPAEEDCEQLGPHYDPTRARLECRTFIGLLRRALGPEPEGARLRIQSNPHDFGTYYDVVIRFEANDPTATAYAYRVEGKAPSRWDPMARAELGLEREREA